MKVRKIMNVYFTDESPRTLVDAEIKIEASSKREKDKIPFRWWPEAYLRSILIRP